MEESIENKTLRKKWWENQGELGHESLKKVSERKGQGLQV